MNYSIQHIAEILQAEKQIESDSMISQLLTDSRRVVSPSDSLFFALKSTRRDGRQFIPELYKKGVRSFVVMDAVNAETLPGANILQVDDTLVALQQLAAFHRRQFTIPVVGITGSNGKTIVKEWLYNLLHSDYNIVRSPKSYNSQIGVPVSVWQMNEHHDLAIFEAGISTQGEMKKLERIIQPTIGILTNVLDAHSEGFNDLSHKFREKITLFQNCSTLIVRGEDIVDRKDVFDMLSDDLQIITWGNSEENDLVIRGIDKQRNESTIQIGSKNRDDRFTIPFTDDASIENAIICYCLMTVLNLSGESVTQRMKELHPVNMRLEMKEGINHCSIINDSYSADLYSLNIALNFLEKQSAGSKRTVILSDFLQSGLDPESLYSEISQLLAAHKIEKVIGIGEQVGTWLKQLTGTEYHFYPGTENFLQAFRSSQFKEETILVKGARVFGFEKIVQALQQQAHQTVLEINLNAIVHNLKEYQRLLKPDTKIMAMVKAFAYGSGGAEIAGILQFHKIDYLGVAYTDEGVELRNAGINLPVMVMNPEPNSFDGIIEHRLEPEIYSYESFRVFDAYLKAESIEQYPVHIELETGMNRLGFQIAELSSLAKELKEGNTCRVQSVFTHLAASEDPGQDDFTRQQTDKFLAAVKIFEQDQTILY